MNNRQIEEYSYRFTRMEDLYLKLKEEYETAMEQHLAWEERQRIIKIIQQWWTEEETNIIGLIALIEENQN